MTTEYGCHQCEEAARLQGIGMDKFERYWKLSEMEERFNSSSGGIRGLASAWLLASLGSIGWIFNAYNAEIWPLPMGFLLIVVITLGSIGITTLWVMDQLVFFRLLNSVFLVGLKMEKDDQELPPIHSIMMKTQEGKGTHRWERFFYLAPISIYFLLSVSIVGAGSEALFQGKQEFFAIDTRFISIVLVCLQALALAWIFYKFRFISQKDRARYFNDPEFTGIVISKSYEKVISRYRSPDFVDASSKANRQDSTANRE
jgi:hypothetical protein